jgi:hypothetical protein
LSRNAHKNTNPIDTRSTARDIPAAELVLGAPVCTEWLAARVTVDCVVICLLFELVC